MKLRISLISLLLLWQIAATAEVVDTVVFPDDFQTDADYTSRNGKVLYFAQTLVVSDNSQWQKYGELKLSSIRLFTPTDLALPNSADYQRLLGENTKNSIYLDDGSDVQNPTPLPFADIDGTRRVGSRINNLKARLRNRGWGWALEPVSADYQFDFYGNERPTSVNFTETHNLKVCAFNLEYYLASNFGTGFGPDNTAQAAVQHSKILKALLAIDADIYGLVEIQQGQEALQKLCQALNTAKGGDYFAFINDGGSTYGSYTKVGFIYRKDKIETIGTLKNINNVVPYRKKLQGFRLKSNQEKFILSLNHFKAKTTSGATGDNADSGDGQGTFNGDRVREANAVIAALPSYQTSVGDQDVLVMGDLNAYAEENPLYVFYQNSFRNMLKNSDSEAYSYIYRGLSGCLDHALANPTMAQQVAGVAVFHINADEPTMFEYQELTVQDNMYRCSDHDAVVVALNLGTLNDLEESEVAEENIFKISESQLLVENSAGCWLSIFDAAGRQILHQRLTSDHEIIETPTSLKGVYFIYLDHRNQALPKAKKVVF